MIPNNPTIATISLSSGAPNDFPDQYKLGKREIQRSLNAEVIETPNATKPDEWLHDHPEERLNDLVWAFNNDEVDAVISNIGGDDSIRLLNHVTDNHKATLKNNAKPFIGLSDTTTITMLLNSLDIPSCYGPSVMYGFGEPRGVHDYTVDMLLKSLNEQEYELQNADEFTVDFAHWSKENQEKTWHKTPSIKYHTNHVCEGRLIGGCAGILEALKDTTVWPNQTKWEHSVLFLETSEIRPHPTMFKLWLRNYAQRGILNAVNGVILGIPGGSIPTDAEDYEDKLQTYYEYHEDLVQAAQTVWDEYEPDTALVTGLQCGHVLPMATLPIGRQIQINAERERLNITKPRRRNEA
jgi:muramoyltetrapeptide carboxypeptidase LdcA involved in peptidoglycan recycling